jgi:hypothetical protein
MTRFAAYVIASVRLVSRLPWVGVISQDYPQLSPAIQSSQLIAHASNCYHRPSPCWTLWFGRLSLVSVPIYGSAIECRLKLPTPCAKSVAHLDSRSLVEAEEVRRFGLCFIRLIACFLHIALWFNLPRKKRLFIFGHLGSMLILYLLWKGFTRWPPTSCYSHHRLFTHFSATRLQCPYVSTTPRSGQSTYDHICATSHPWPSTG